MSPKFDFLFLVGHIQFSNTNNFTLESICRIIEYSKKTKIENILITFSYHFSCIA